MPPEVGATMMTVFIFSRGRCLGERSAKCRHHCSDFAATEHFAAARPQRSSAASAASRGTHGHVDSRRSRGRRVVLVVVVVVTPTFRHSVDCGARFLLYVPSPPTCIPLDARLHESESSSGRWCGWRRWSAAGSLRQQLPGSRESATASGSFAFRHRRRGDHHQHP